MLDDVFGFDGVFNDFLYVLMFYNNDKIMVRVEVVLGY